MDKICKYIDRELEEYENKVAMGGKLSPAEVNYGKDLAKFKSALLTNERMESDGYSNDTYDYTRERTGTNRMQSNARNTSNRRETSRRYNTGYSRAEAEEEFVERLEDLMESAPDEHKRKKIERLLDEMR